jgi:hypothetical protein
MGTIRVRLDPESEQALNRLVRETGKTKSEIVREALTRLPRKRSSKKAAVRPYDLMKSGIGCVSSGDLNPSQRAGDKFYEILAEKKKRSEERNREYYEARTRELQSNETRRPRKSARTDRRHRAKT